MELKKSSDRPEMNRNVAIGSDQRTKKLCENQAAEMCEAVEDLSSSGGSNGGGFTPIVRFAIGSPPCPDL